MQKKLIALAVAGLVSGGAFAQSSAVTVYGVADLSFDSVKTSGGSTPNVDTKTGSYTRVSSNSSYIGFKGTEDLGNGLKALFQFENAVSADNGNTFGANRDTYAGLAGAFGAIKLGVLTTPTRALGTAIDVNAGATSIGANSALINRAGFDNRQTNTALYTSPSFMGGFTVAGAYISGENKTENNDSVTNQQADRRAWDLGATYKNGPILVGLTYVQDKARDAADAKTKNIRIAGAYDFGVGSVRLLWNSAKAEGNAVLPPNAVAASETKQKAWGIGGTFNATPNGKLVAQYYKANNVTGIDNSGAKLFELGYEHSFSKRTMLKVIYARLNNEDAAAYNFSVNPVNNPANGVDPSGFQVGIRHSF